jgi:hypothetical protein
MARPKKGEEKAKEGATLSIDVDSFVRTRDSVVTGLATLQDAIQTLSSAYIKHTNAVLGEHGAGLDVESALSKLGENPLLGGLGNLRAASPAKSVTVVAADDKRERKKRQHDPNAPKRPLTPFFLYMQTARPIIAADLGPDFAKGAVSAEGTQRWAAMSASDKQLWTNAYKDNLRLYNARMHSYRAGNLSAKDMSDSEAATYANEHSIGVEATGDAQLAEEAVADHATAALDEDEDAEGEIIKEPTPPPKTPKSKPGRKSKTTANKTTPIAAAESIVPPSSSIVPPKTVEKEKVVEKKSPEKRKRVAKKGKEADEPVASIEKDEFAVQTPKTAEKAAKPRKKKPKTDA